MNRHERNGISAVCGRSRVFFIRNVLFRSRRESLAGGRGGVRPRSREAAREKFPQEPLAVLHRVFAAIRRAPE